MTLFGILKSVSRSFTQFLRFKPARLYRFSASKGKTYCSF